MNHVRQKVDQQFADNPSRKYDSGAQ